MIWSVTIPGQPVGWNHAYQNAPWAVERQGVPVMKGGQQVVVTRRIKSEKARQWQATVTLLVQNARPARWQPGVQLRVLLDLHLVRDMDADNILKTLLDAVAAGLECNDSIFLPCVRSKEHGLRLRDARVELTFDDD